MNNNIEKDGFEIQKTVTIKLDYGAEEPKVGEVWKHTKTGREYRVIGIYNLVQSSKFNYTDRDIIQAVHYQSTDDFTHWVRPLHDWLSFDSLTVTVDNFHIPKYFPRFTKMFMLRKEYTIQEEEKCPCYKLPSSIICPYGCEDSSTDEEDLPELNDKANSTTLPSSSPILIKEKAYNADHCVIQ